MERRYYKRISPSVKVLIYRGGLPVAVAEVKDVSKFGFFVEADFIDVALYQALDFELPLRDGGNLRHFRFRAQVTRKSGHGLALSVEQDNEEACEALLILSENHALARAVSVPMVASG